MHNTHTHHAQDWNYMAAGCMETTLELSQMKFPSASQLPALWDQNRDALISYALAASLGGALFRAFQQGSESFA